jgi:ribosomal protein S18 acetylase RimI-like enzyme
VRPRRATLGDLDALIALEARFPSDRISARAYKHLLTRAHAEVWVAGERGRIVASIVILFRRGAGMARLYSVVTDPAYRGRGIGGRLVSIAERRAVEHGCDRIGLEVRARDTRVRRWYTLLGYVTQARIPDFYEDGAPALRMRKSLG